MVFPKFGASGLLISASTSVLDSTSSWSMAGTKCSCLISLNGGVCCTVFQSDNNGFDTLFSLVILIVIIPLRIIIPLKINFFILSLFIFSFLIFSFSHLLIFSSSHFLIFPPSHFLIFPFSHLPTFSFSHLPTFSFSIFPFSHLLIFPSSHLPIFSFSHLPTLCNSLFGLLFHHTPSKLPDLIPHFIIIAMRISH